MSLMFMPPSDSESDSENDGLISSQNASSQVNGGAVTADLSEEQNAALSAADSSDNDGGESECMPDLDSDYSDEGSHKKGQVEMHNDIELEQILLQEKCDQAVGRQTVGSDNLLKQKLQSVANKIDQGKTLREEGKEFITRKRRKKQSAAVPEPSASNQESSRVFKIKFLDPNQTERIRLLVKDDKIIPAVARAGKVDPADIKVRLRSANGKGTGKILSMWHTVGHVLALLAQDQSQELDENVVIDLDIEYCQQENDMLESIRVFDTQLSAQTADEPGFNGEEDDTEMNNDQGSSDGTILLTFRYDPGSSRVKEAKLAVDKSQSLSSLELKEIITSKFGLARGSQKSMVIIDPDGDKICDEDTAEDLDLEDGDVLDVKLP